jgi:UDP-N-acetyl-D-glucosamine dehydrogenase
MTDLATKIVDRSAVVGVLGLGYVGLPLVRTFAARGFRTLGFDVDPRKIAALKERRSYLRTVPARDVATIVDGGRFDATTDFDRLPEADALIVCVPTPLTKTREPDLQYIEATTDEIGRRLRHGQLVVLESTTWPGTTEEVVLPRLARLSGLTVGTDYYLAYSPEREDPGNARFDTRSIPKVVAGVTEACLARAAALYGAAVERVVPVSSTRAAELCKLLENIYRAVNIALVNELKMLCHRMDLDVFEIIAAASTKPFGFQAFYPGPGLGGHCIPIDPFYLTSKAREYEMTTRFIELAGEINTAMPEYVVGRVMHALNTHERSLKGAGVLVLGIAYKKDIDDVRESPAVRIIELLVERGARVSYNDPYVPETPRMRAHDLQMRSVELTAARLAAADCVLIVTDHGAYDYDWIVEHARLVVDSRNATGRVTRGREKIYPA